MEYQDTIKTVKAKPCGIVLKDRRPFFYSRTATFRMTDGKYFKEPFVADRRNSPKILIIAP